MKELEKRYEIARWISQELSGILSESDIRKLNEWRRETEENEREYKEICLRLEEDLKKGNRLDIAHEWNLFETKLSPQRKIKRWWIYAVAGCAVIGLMIATLWTQPMDGRLEKAQALNDRKAYKAVLILGNGQEVSLEDSTHMLITEARGAKIVRTGNSVRYDVHDGQQEEEVEWNTIIVPRGGEYKLLLSDGTRVWLNSESQLTYPVRFGGKQREVAMKGEVCFDVARNENAPFMVKTDKMTVKVLGTLFNVEAYPEDHKVTTTLVKGKVEISTNRDQLILVPDRQAIIGEDGVLIVKDVFAEEYVSWTNGIFHFTEASLEEIMTRLSRWYNIDFFFANPAIKKAHFTLDIRRYDHVTDILSKIEKTGRVKFKVNGNTIVAQE